MSTKCQREEYDISFKNQQLKDVNKTLVLYLHITIIRSVDQPTSPVLPHRRFIAGLGTIIQIIYEFHYF